MSFVTVLVFAFFLGMRHATDPDHVVAVATIVSRKQTLRAAAPIGALWGLGHTLTILLVGGAIVVLGLVVPARLGLGMELIVALMLVLLGAVNVRNVFGTRAVAADRHDENRLDHAKRSVSANLSKLSSVRPVLIGVVHGLAGSAAVALLVLGTIREPLFGIAYLIIFGIGTIAGMLLITVALAMPIVAAARRFEGLHQTLALLTGIAGILFGAYLVYDIGFAHGLFTGKPEWTPG
jgi:high-affinity nickel-transport protein